MCYELRYPTGGRVLLSQLKSVWLAFLFPIISQFCGLLFHLSVLDKYRKPFFFLCQKKKKGKFFYGSVIL